MSADARGRGARSRAPAARLQTVRRDRRGRHTLADRVAVDGIADLQEEEDAEGKAATAIDYLEKIFQIPFWIEPLDDDSRQSLMRGLLLPSVAVPTDAGAAQTGASVQVGEPESDLVGGDAVEVGTWLDLDAQKFTITPEELQFIERLSPLIVGTPRQVKRFVTSASSSSRWPASVQIR